MRSRWCLSVLASSCSLVAGGLLITGCSNDDQVEGSGPKAQPSPPIKTDQLRARDGLPGAVVVRLWSHLRRGNIPLALNAFDANVVAGVGRKEFIGALGVARGTATAYAPTIVRTEAIMPRAGGAAAGGKRKLTALYVEGKGTQGAVARSTFLLQDTPFGWTIVYDTLTDDSLRTFVATSQQLAPKKGDRLPAKIAGEAGAAASRDYQDAANTAAGTFF